jgi:hypothetical protein
VANAAEIDREILAKALPEIAGVSGRLQSLLGKSLGDAVGDIQRVRMARGSPSPPEIRPFGAPESWTAKQLQGLSLPEQLEACRRALIGLQPALAFGERKQAAEIMARAVNRRVQSGSATDEAAAVAAAIKHEGYHRFDRLLDEQAAEAVRQFLASRPCYNGHTPSMSDNFARRIGAGAEAFHYGSYSLSDVLRAPYLIELANSPVVTGAAELYLGCVPTLYSLNAWWSFPIPSGPARYSQSFHRDRDDLRFCTLFIFLTDVTEDRGPHVYVRRTHRPELIESRLAELDEAELSVLDQDERQLLDANTLATMEGYGTDRIIEAVFGEQSDVVAGPAGTAILADTFGFHKGILPQVGSRLMFWARYGTYANFSPPTQRVNRSLVGDRLPADERTRYITRALFSD